MKALFPNTYIVPQSGSNLCHNVTCRFERRMLKTGVWVYTAHAFWEKAELRSPPAGQNPMVIICIELSLKGFFFFIIFHSEYNLRN